MNQVADIRKYGSFAEGLYQMSLKGIIGKQLRLTLQRAILLQEMIKRLEDYVPEEDYDDYCATLEWLRQQIRRRYPDLGIGLIGIHIELTKERAWTLRSMIKRLSVYAPDDDSTYQLTIDWINQEIQKLYSEFNLGMI